MVSQIELVVISKRCLHFRITFLPLVEFLQDPRLPPVEKVHQPETVGDEGKLNDKLDVEVLLCHHLSANDIWPFHYVFASERFQC